MFLDTVKNLFLPGANGAIRMVDVDLGTHRAQVPVADIAGQRSGSTFLVTAGMDGDEYAGIEAAYRLIDRYRDGDFSGRLVVIPIVNVDGFWNESSHNPTDGKFPKYIFPGSANGSPTERLVHWLVDNYVHDSVADTQANCWLDMHSGAITESLSPFLWLYHIDDNVHDSVADNIIHANMAEIVVYEKAGFGSKAMRLAQKGCTYVIAESGSRGNRNEDDVTRHVHWAEGVMHAFGMINKPPTLVAEQKVFRHVTFVRAPWNGIWQPIPFSNNEIKGGSALGTCMTLDAKTSKTLFAPKNGERLWWKETMTMRRGDILYAIGW